MPQKRKTFSLSETDCNSLQQLADDCGMDASQCIAQLIRRHSVDIRTLFSLDVSNRKQTYADSHTTAYEPIAVDASLPSGPIDKTQVTPVDPADTTPGNAFLSMEF